ncbi:MAG: hypothetical protein PVJ75_08360, partial [Chloroflexota bacterium]
SEGSYNSIIFESVWQAADGGYVVAGRRSGIGGLRTGVVLKVDQAGDILWYNRYVGGYFQAVTGSQAGGYVVAGRSDEDDAMVMRLDESGQMGDACYIVDEAYADVIALDGPVEDENKESRALNDGSYQATIVVTAAELVAEQVCPVP